MLACEGLMVVFSGQEWLSWFELPVAIPVDVCVSLLNCVCVAWFIRSKL